MKDPRRWILLKIWLAVCATNLSIGLVFLLYLELWEGPHESPPGQLADRVQTGMTPKQVEAIARRLGFDWRVDEKQLLVERGDGKRAGQIDCHVGSELPKPARYASFYCEDRRDARTDNRYTCQITMKEGKVFDVVFDSN